MNDDETRAMLIEYMAKGFLENIIALFRREPELFRFIPDMIADEQIVVRMGTTALVEELNGEFGRHIRTAVPGLVALLKNANPTIRGDAVNLLGIIGDPAAREAISGLTLDDNEAVRMLAREAIEELDR